MFGGEGGIRTHGSGEGTPVFKSWTTPTAGYLAPRNAEIDYHYERQLTLSMMTIEMQWQSSGNRRLGSRSVSQLAAGGGGLVRTVE